MSTCKTEIQKLSSSIDQNKNKKQKQQNQNQDQDDENKNDVVDRTTKQPAAQFTLPPKNNNNNNNNNDFPAERSGGQVIKGPGDDPSQDPKGTIPILLLTYNRAALVEKLLKRIQELIFDKNKNDNDSTKNQQQKLPPFRVFVSQDIDETRQHSDVTQTIQNAQSQLHRSLGIVFLMHNRDDSGATFQEQENGWKPYYAISRHYAWALAKVFETNEHYQRVIILEEDLELAFDFFEYMSAMSKLFDKDPKLYCVSGFNDNGKPGLVQDPSAVYRSDFFPGLGWMLSKSLWESELRAKWPKGFWDDWMRQPSQRKGRSCVRPEISRSKPRCEDGEGASQGQFCSDHLKLIVLNDESRARRVNWGFYQLDTLLSDVYDHNLEQEIKHARTVYNVNSIFASTPGGSMDTAVVKMEYTSNEEFVVLAQSLNLMDDFKDGVPRTAYHGAVTLKWRGAQEASGMGFRAGLLRSAGGGGGDEPKMYPNDIEDLRKIRKVLLVSPNGILYDNKER